MTGALGRGLRVVGLWALMALAAPVAAQETQGMRSPVLTIDSERLFADSAFGKRVAEEFEAEGRVLEAENRRIEGELIEEEKRLTNQRPQMTPEAFRKLADAFDAKVQKIRAEQNAKTRALTQQTDLAQLQFLTAVRPELEGLMADAGAALIVERRSVFLSARIIDVTEEAVARIDAAIGDGSGLPDPKPQE
ncbi:OmpH family outer membrane protein [Thalassovita taeanensis]|uniref:Periplasmic chaperone for outer membrane proteins Skp n=1 Tax=Thalassovita taeanensis TaxID=657014 RepID=A0A1H8ZHT6_9RHOB|nr:OmpH family outer membrane protein [Thalassovita taeanensis]SEP63996.1 periplasmic chaperone for outer membrane proteins Skp [Thalassovita taeanensis]